LKNKENILQLIRNRHNTSNGSNGVSVIEIINLFGLSKLETETILNELFTDGLIEVRQGINLKMAFFKPKKLSK
jgi:predicted transcriptional regulator